MAQGTSGKHVCSQGWFGIGQVHTDTRLCAQLLHTRISLERNAFVPLSGYRQEAAFEKDEYTILWVTRTTLKSDVFKNMFDLVCSVPLKNKMKAGFKIPDGQSERMRLLSKSWRIKPMYYKQFSNLVSGKNKLYEDLVAIHGRRIL
jgi:hypothetical protein